MSRQPVAYNQILQLLQKLHKAFPSYNMGRHISTALDEYGDVWNVTDKEMLFALEKYSNQLDVNDSSEEAIDSIIKEGMDLDNILKEEDDNGDIY